MGSSISQNQNGKVSREKEEEEDEEEDELTDDEFLFMIGVWP